MADRSGPETTGVRVCVMSRGIQFLQLYASYKCWAPESVT